MKTLCKRLKEHGVDTDGVINRLGKNESLYLSICLKFLSDRSYPLLQEALKAGNLEEVRAQIHTLKGVAANLGFLYMHALCKHILVFLDQNNRPPLEQDLRSLSQEYHILIAILSEAIN